MVVKCLRKYTLKIRLVESNCTFGGSHGVESNCTLGGSHGVGSNGLAFEFLDKKLTDGHLPHPPPHKKIFPGREVNSYVQV